MQPILVAHRKLLSALLMVLLSGASLLAQQPAYFMMGAEEFQGLQIYDVIQDRQDNYLISTNEGLFYYDYLRFERMGCEQSSGGSLFNLVADASGNIYCSNLNHQIFRIRDGKCSLIYTLLPDEDSPDLSLICSDDGELLACSRKVIRLSPEGSALERWGPWSKPLAKPFKTTDGRVIMHCPGTDTLLCHARGHLGAIQLPGFTPPEQTQLMFNFYSVDEQLYAINLLRNEVYAVEDSCFTMRMVPGKHLTDMSGPLRLYPAGPSTWMAGSLPGVAWLKSSPEKAPPSLLYERHFISDVFLDHEGNHLLSTFDHGIIVIPDLETPDVIAPFSEDPISSLHVSPDDHVLHLGSTKGNLLRYHSGKLSTLAAGGNRSIEGIFGDPQRLVFQGGDQIMALNGSGIQIPLGLKAALKDAIFISRDEAYLATSVGIFRCRWSAAGMPSLAPLAGFDFRIHHMVYAEADQALVAATSRGLFHIPLQGTASRILLTGENVYPTALCAAEGRTYAATSREGILVLVRGAPVSQIHPETSPLDIIGKMVVHQGRLYAKTSHGIYQLGPDGSIQRNISRAFGFDRSRVYDFAMDGSTLWVSHSRGVQAIDLSSAAMPAVPPPLRLSRITVNDHLVSPSTPGQFSHEKRKISFDLAIPSLRQRGALRIHYQLQGYDTTWQMLTEGQPTITYNALAAGNYTFRAKAERQGLLGQPVAYSFSIVAPIHRRWWFTAAILLLVIGGSAGIYGRHMRQQRRKAQQLSELNSSKLVAIQSQMNPHFIFNSMNSIQDLILKGDIENSYSYVTTFSNLVRSTLKHSEKEFIDFGQELELLQLYLSLEKLRFEEDLQFEIISDVDSDIQIPPLLIQPFVENALLHGLLHKQGEKRLAITFSLQESLVCTIEDNGVGRARAKAIRDRQRGDHESFSGKAIRTRFDILSEVFKGEFGYHYEDLVTNGEASGTRITLRIPVRRRY